MIRPVVADSSANYHMPVVSVLRRRNGVVSSQATGPRRHRLHISVRLGGLAF